MRVYVAIEHFGDYALGRGQTMTSAVVGVFRDKERAFCAAEKRAWLWGEHKTRRMHGKYLVSQEGAILFEIVGCKIG